MNSSTMISQQALSQQATDALAQGDYEQALNLYEALLESDPDHKSYAWHLGLIYLLQGYEAEAQMTWTLAMAEAGEEQLQVWTEELIVILTTEAQRQNAIGNSELAWIIHQHIQQINPVDINTVLQSLLNHTQKEEDSIEQVIEELINSGVVNLLQSDQYLEESNPLRIGEPEQNLSVDSDLLFQVMQAILEQGYPYAAVFEFVQASVKYFPDTEAAIKLILEKASHIGYVQRRYELACRYAELCLELNSDHWDTLGTLSYFYMFVMKYEEAIQLAKHLYSFCKTPAEKAFGSAAILRSLTRAGGHWEEANAWLETRQEWLHLLLEMGEADPASVDISLLSSTAFYLPYFADEPEETRSLLNRIANLSKASLDSRITQAHGADYLQQLFPPRPRKSQKRPLRIAYMSCFMRRHSIGWLARWLFKHHDRDRFEIQAYFMQQSQVDAFGQKWYADQADQAACFHGDPLEMAQALYENEVDILVDLDSLSVDAAATILLLKPVPIQVTWLGWDASGLPTIDYYIADRYNLPENAQDYYAEKIWRMPTTYLAVDGFEVGIPTLRRDILDVPMDAVLYFSSQSGQKRNPDNIRAQLKILKEVPNSYFLIKGIGDKKSLQTMFERLTAEEGVAFDRLRFLPPTADEETHRANLAIADVVLDTFPYNGATTTMETLWMGIPMVTKVGKQFSARNSYGMMINAGIEEGIAWNDEEYIEWGIRLGKDPALRQQIALRLKQARQTSPLFNAKQFTRDMEAAFEQMWQVYLHQG